MLPIELQSKLMESEYIKLASRHLASLGAETINSLLVDMADAVERSTETILAANVFMNVNQSFSGNHFSDVGTQPADTAGKKPKRFPSANCSVPL